MIITEKFIEKAKAIHKDSVIYDEVEYVRCDVPVKLICPKHGEFWMTPSHHLDGHSCHKCHMEKITFNSEKFIEKAKEVHKNDEVKVIYDEVDYVNAKTKVKLICPIHGEFWQTPDTHLRGGSCPTCAKEKFIQQNKERAMTPDRFFKKMKDMYGDTLIFDEAVYVDYHTKLKVICPIHGEFYKTPQTLIQGQGCNECGKMRGIEKLLKYTDEEFRQICSEVLKDGYDFSKTHYNGMFKPCIVTCKKHGDFKTYPCNIINGHGCAKCAFERNSQLRKHDLKWLIEKGNEIHKGRYDYSEVEMDGVLKKVKIKCNKCGNYFYATPHNHINQKSGCPFCRQSHLELNINDALIENKIEFISQYRNKEIFGRKSIDFYIPKLNIAIECQGEQHFKGKFKKDKPDNIIERDLIKSNECKQNNIDLIYYIPKILYKEMYLKDEKYKSLYNVNNTFSDINQIINYIKEKGEGN